MTISPTGMPSALASARTVLALGTVAPRAMHPSASRDSPAFKAKPSWVRPPSSRSRATLAAMVVPSVICARLSFDNGSLKASLHHNA